MVLLLHKIYNIYYILNIVLIHAGLVLIIVCLAHMRLYSAEVVAENNTIN